MILGYLACNTMQLSQLPDDALGLILEQLRGGPCNQVCRRWRRLMGKYQYDIKHFTGKPLAVIAAMCGYVPNTLTWFSENLETGPARLLADILQGETGVDFTYAFLKRHREFTDICPRQWCPEGVTARDILMTMFSPHAISYERRYGFKILYWSLRDIGLLDLAMVLTALKICTDQNIWA